MPSALKFHILFFDFLLPTLLVQLLCFLTVIFQLLGKGVLRFGLLFCRVLLRLNDLTDPIANIFQRLQFGLHRFKLLADLGDFRIQLLVFRFQRFEVNGNIHALLAEKTVSLVVSGKLRFVFLGVLFLSGLPADFHILVMDCLVLLASSNRLFDTGDCFHPAFLGLHGIADFCGSLIQSGKSFVQLVQSENVMVLQIGNSGRNDFHILSLA